MSKNLLELKNISAGYEGRSVLKDVSLSIEENDFLGIIGPNGGGKTTLLKIILGLLQPYKGTISFANNVDKGIGYMPQINNIDKQFPILVSEVVLSGLYASGLNKSEECLRVQELMQEMGLLEIANKAIGNLSGGQMQRVLLARAIANKPKLLVLDEPSTYVDKRFEAKFYEQLKEINKKTAIILVSHDVGTVISTVKNIACVNENLHFHAGNDVDSSWLEEHLACPFELVGHGKIPHRILKDHDD